MSLDPPTSHVFFFFNDTATTEIYTLSLHDALPILRARAAIHAGTSTGASRSMRSTEPPAASTASSRFAAGGSVRSEEHTSELQSQSNLVGRLLLEKKKRSRPDSESRRHSHPPQSAP